MINNSGEIIKTEFLVEGRKQPLIEIRERTLRSQEQYMRHTSDEDFRNMHLESVITSLKEINEYHDGGNEDEMRARLKKFERTRHIKMWHDLSTVANHSHLVFMVSCLYDPAIHYTNEEYLKMTNIKEDVQARVESPEVYIVARSGSSDAEQLAYVDTRRECLEDMRSKLTTNSGTDVTDKMIFFHGDSPARELECGQQKGGNYYCSGCGAYAQRVYELDYCFRCRWMSLSDRQQLMLNGPYGRKNYLEKAYKPLQKLKKQELIAELNSRGIFEGETKSELEKLLQDEMHGAQRVPVLLYNTPTTSLESINCENYEILSFEPLHDIGKHIENVLTELPAHLPAEEAKDVEEVINLSMEGKDTKRTFD